MPPVIPQLFNAQGNIDAGGAISLLYDQVEVRTALTPSIFFPISAQGAAQPNPLRDGIIKILQPTIIFSGPAGTQTIAPYGATAGETSWLPVIAIGGAVILGIGWLIFGK